MKTIFNYLPTAAREKVYLITASICLILLFFSISQSAPIIVESGAMFGFGSYLHFSYWIGLGLLLLCSIFAFLDAELKKDAVFLFILFTLGFFLIGLVSFITSLPRGPEAYHPTVVGMDILQSHHLDISATEALLTYRQWPGTQFLSATLLAVTNVEVLSLIRYAPVFWFFLFMLAAYSFGKRLKLSHNLCFAVGFLAISSAIVFPHNFSPQGIALLVYVMVLFLLIPLERTWQKALLLILAFGALSITHSLTPLAIIAASIGVLIYTRQTNLLILFIVIWFTWYLYEANLAFQQGLTQWWAHPLQSILFLVSPEKMESYAAPAASAGRTFWRTCQLSYAAIYLLLLFASGILFLWKSVKGQQRKLLAYLFLSLVGLPLINLVGFWEAPSRTYMYALVPVIAIVLITFHNRRVFKPLVGVLMLVTVALNMPAHYGGEASWAQVLPAELRGEQFFAQEIRPEPKPTDKYFAHYLTLIMFYCGRDMHEVEGSYPSQIRRMVGKDDVTQLDTKRYVLLSEQGHNLQMNSWGVDAYQSWPETERGSKADLIYHNGHFRIYRNQYIGR